MYDWIISDFPEPVVPATKPCGPCAFSCKFNDKMSSLPLTPKGTAIVLYVSFCLHRLTTSS